MSTGPRTRRQSTAPAAGPGLGERLRQLRIAAGLTQTELVGERFSKEYVSQIERGKTRPTAETIEWIARRLGVDPSFLVNGVSADERGRVEALLARAEAQIEAGQETDALAELESLKPSALGVGLPEVEFRHLLAESRARTRLGQIRAAIELLTRARVLSEHSIFSDVERADVLCRLGVCRYRLSSISTALALLNEGLALAEGSGLPCDLLRSQILDWRSRCYRRQRDFEAAREDVERAIELAEGLNDPYTVGQVYFQASIIAEREGHWVLARTYAERAKGCFEEISDRENVGRLLNNLGGLNFLLGKPEQAIELLKNAFRVALELGNEPDAAQAVSSLAQVHLRTGDVVQAEEQARHALQLLAGRVDYLDEIGNAQLVLGRAVLEQGRLDEAEQMFDAAEASFEQLSSASHRAAAWMAKGDLAAKRNHDQEAARLFRQAAEALQDFRF